jgi:hypothetical protein
VPVSALVDDLMDRSRITAAIPDVTFVRDAGAAAGSDVVVVDLARHGDDVAAIRAAVPDALIVAFGPHVDEASFATAQRDGADRILARSQFFHDVRNAIA